MPKQKKLLKRITAALTAASTVSIFAVSAYAMTEQRVVGYMGDLDGDMSVSLSDVYILGDHLLSENMIADADVISRADLNKDQCIDARDLTLLKRIAAKQLDDALFVEYWGESVPVEKRISKWLEKADAIASGCRPSEVLFLSSAKRRKSIQ